jgi:hypothetical protein
VRSTLASGEDGGVDPGLNVGLLVLAEEDETSTGTTQGLVTGNVSTGLIRILEHLRGGGDNVAELEWRALLSSSDQTRDVGHVAHEVGTLSIGNLPETSIVPVTGVGGSTADEQSRLEEVGVGLELRVVDQTGFGVDTVWERLEVDGRGGDLLLGGVVTVGKVATCCRVKTMIYGCTIWLTIGETETHDTVLRVDESSECGKATTCQSSIRA